MPRSTLLAFALIMLLSEALLSKDDELIVHTVAFQADATRASLRLAPTDDIPGKIAAFAQEHQHRTPDDLRAKLMEETRRQALLRVTRGQQWQPGTGTAGENLRAYVGNPSDWDLVPAMTFSLLAALGMRDRHRVLDVGCGCLRIGRLLIPYLQKGGYAGVEPNLWQTTFGMLEEVGPDVAARKLPVFAHSCAELDPTTRRFDFAVAHSILSHTGADMFEETLRETATLRAPQGVLIATVVEGNTSSPAEARGWVYPYSYKHTPVDVRAMASRAGLHAVRLDWWHPRQRWWLFARDMERAHAASGELSWNAGAQRGLWGHAPRGFSECETEGGTPKTPGVQVVPV